MQLSQEESKPTQAASFRATHFQVHRKIFSRLQISSSYTPKKTGGSLKHSTSAQASDTNNVHRQSCRVNVLALSFFVINIVRSFALPCVHTQTRLHIYTYTHTHAIYICTIYYLASYFILEERSVLFRHSHACLSAEVQENDSTSTSRSTLYNTVFLMLGSHLKVYYCTSDSRDLNLSA